MDNCLLPTRCEHCKYTGEHTVQYKNKKIPPYTFYCTAEKKHVRVIGNKFHWAGISPDFCPRRKEAENAEDKG